MELRKAGVNDKDIAAALGVHEDTFGRWKNRPTTENQRRLSRALEKTEADYKANLLTLIYNNAVQRDWKAAAWLLERKYPEEFSRMVKTQGAHAEQKAEAPVFVFERGGDEG